jgi:hypothetical protein
VGSFWVHAGFIGELWQLARRLKHKEEEINDMLHGLGIGEDDFDDMVFEEVDSAPKEVIKWMALVRVHTKKLLQCLYLRTTHAGGMEPC